VPDRPSENPDEYARGLLELDRIVAAEANGCFTVPINENTPVYDFRSMLKYCDEKGIDSAELTDEQLKQFEVTK